MKATIEIPSGWMRVRSGPILEGDRWLQWLDPDNVTWQPVKNYIGHEAGGPTVPWIIRHIPIDPDAPDDIGEYKRRVIEMFRDNPPKDPALWDEMAEAVLRESEGEGRVQGIDHAIGFASGTGDDDEE